MDWTKIMHDVYEHASKKAIVRRHDRQTGLHALPAGWKAEIDGRPIREHNGGSIIEFRTWTGAAKAAERRMRKAGIIPAAESAQEAAK